MQKLKYSILLFTAVMTLLNARDRTVFILGDDIVIEAGKTVDAAIALGGDIDVYGTVEEAVVAIGGDVTIHSEGVVAGDAVSVGGQVFLSAGGTLEGDQVVVQSGRIGQALNPAHFFTRFYIPWVLRFVSLMSLLSIVLIIALLFPNLITGPADRFRAAPGKALLIGVSAVVLFVPILILLIISIIGVPLIPILVFSYGLAYLVGYLLLGYLLGKRLLNAFQLETATVLMTALVGVGLVWFIGQIPFLGMLLKMIVFLSGLGVMLLSLAHVRKKPAGETG
jgi:hypothetical protein